MVAAIAEELQKETAEAWAERLAPLGVVAAAVQTLPDALDGPLTASRDMVVEVPIGGDTLRMIGNPIKDESHKSEVRPPPTWANTTPYLAPVAPGRPAHDCALTAAAHLARADADRQRACREVLAEIGDAAAAGRLSDWRDRASRRWKVHTDQRAGR